MIIQQPRTLLLIFVLVLTLAGCNGDSDNNDDSNWACLDVYQPVCGLITKGDSQHYQTFSNSCMANNNNAQVSFDGECETLEGQNSEASQPIIIHSSIEDLPEEATSLTVVDSEISGHIALATFQHGGGCGEHAINLHVAPPFMESWPLQIHTRLTHQTDDACKALITSTISIDLRPLKELYHENYQSDSGEIIIQHIGLYSF